MVIIPKIATIHIQKMAPGPPEMMAVATPAMLPVPMVAARAVQRLWNWLIALSSLPVWAVIFLLVKMPPTVDFIQWVKWLTWKPFVNTVISTPVPMSSTSMGMPHTKLLTALLTSVICFTNSSISVSPLPLCGYI